MSRLGYIKTSLKVVGPYTEARTYTKPNKEKTTMQKARLLLFIPLLLGVMIPVGGIAKAPDVMDVRASSSDLDVTMRITAIEVAHDGDGATGDDAGDLDFQYPGHEQGLYDYRSYTYDSYVSTSENNYHEQGYDVDVWYTFGIDDQDGWFENRIFTFQIKFLGDSMCVHQTVYIGLWEDLNEDVNYFYYNNYGSLFYYKITDRWEGNGHANGLRLQIELNS